MKLRVRQEPPIAMHVDGAENVRLKASSPIIIRPRESDVYTGRYAVTPSLEPQTVETKNKVLLENVEISAFPYSQLGLDLERVKTLMDSEWTMEETEYPDWDPSTTAKVIVPSTNLEVYASSMTEYDYYLHWQYRADIAYAAGTTMKAVPVREIVDLWQVLIRRPSSLANITAEVYNANTCVTYFSAPLLEYYNTSGTRTFTWSATYGFYPSAVAATFSSSTAADPNVTIKSPSISARCNSSYFAVARGANVDREVSTLRLAGELLRVRSGSSPARKFFENVVAQYNE